jgi:NitT/TauT family transport system substrate-binding protein
MSATPCRWLRSAALSACAVLPLAHHCPALADDALSVVLGARTPTLMNTLNIIAEGAGFYKEEHLTVSKVLVSGALESAQLCSSGQRDICPIGIEPLLTNYSDGVRLKMFLARASKFSYVIVVPEDSPIRKLTDFKGKSIGVHTISAAASGVFTTQSALSVAGLKPTDYTLVPIGYENEAADALASGKVAGAAFPYYELIPLMVAGRKFRMFYHPTLKNVPNAGYAAAPAVMAAKGNALRRFSRAIVKASLLIRYNAPAAARLLLSADGKPWTDEELRRKTAELTAWQNDLPAADPNNKRIGALSVSGMQRYIQLLADAGVTKTAIPASAVVTEDYIAFANDFDHRALEKFAKSLP